jgi:hypothetical protein
MKVTQISHNRLAEILEQSTVETINTGGLLSHTIDHPTLGKCQTIQGNGDGCLLITENKNKQSRAIHDILLKKKPNNIAEIELL